MRRALLLAATLVLAGCQDDRGSLKQVDTGNPDAPAFLLGTVDSCRVWRLRDRGAGRDVYVSTCAGASKSQWTEGCGKGCSRLVESLAFRVPAEAR